MAPLITTTRTVNDDRCWSGRAAMIGVAIACLLQSGSSFVIPTSRHVTAPMFQQHTRQQRQLPRRQAHSAASRPRPTELAAGASSTHPQQQSPPATAAPAAPTATAAETAVQSVFLESLVAEEQDARKPVKSLEAAKRELLERVGYGTTSPGAERPKSEEERVGYLLEVLEGNYTPIQTVGFFNFAAQGEWDIAYTNAAMLPIGPRLTVYEQFQRIEPGDGMKGTFTNVITWRLLDEGLDGRLEVGGEYQIDPRGRMNASLVNHKITPDGKMPKDPQGLVSILRRAMPHELFDPDDHAMSTTFLDNTMRIVRISGPKFEGRLNIFARRVNNDDNDKAGNGEEAQEAETEGAESRAAPVPTAPADAEC